MELDQPPTFRKAQQQVAQQKPAHLAGFFQRIIVMRYQVVFDINSPEGENRAEVTA